MKTALVTGGSHGIGLACAVEIAANPEVGAVIITGRTLARLEQARSRLVQAQVDVFTVANDALAEDAASRLWARVLELRPGVDILVNNVGGGGRWEVSHENYRGVMQKNFFFAADLVELAVPWMRRARWGRVVTVSSIHGREAGGSPCFSAAKAAQVAANKAWSQRREVASRNVTFNVISPGTLDIPGTGTDALTLTERCALGQKLPRGRMGYAEEVAKVLGFLVSDGAAHVNGVNLVVDGGESRSF